MHFSGLPHHLGENLLPPRYEVANFITKLILVVTDKCSFHVQQRNTSLQKTETKRENHNRSYARGQESVESQPSMAAHTTQFLFLRLKNITEEGHNNFKSQGTRKSAMRLCLLGMTRKLHPRCCSNIDAFTRLKPWRYQYACDHEVPPLDN